MLQQSLAKFLEERREEEATADLFEEQEQQDQDMAVL